MCQRILAGIILSLTAAASVAAPISGQGTWETTLQGRVPLTPGGTDYQAYYDTDLNITWLANANLAATNDFGAVGFQSDGSTDWDYAQGWIAAMNAANYLGVNDWRLPTFNTATYGGTCNPFVPSFSGGSCGFNVDPSSGEMAHMSYSTLGNIGFYNTSGVPQPCATDGLNDYCLTNTGPFSNLQSHAPYWSGTEAASDHNYVWVFDFGFGQQGTAVKAFNYYAWAVRPGDIGVVPIPAAVWLLGSALGMLAWARRRFAS